MGNGTYTIDPDGSGGNAPFDVYCDMDNGGYSIDLGCINQTYVRHQISRKYVIYSGRAYCVSDYMEHSYGNSRRSGR